MQSTTIAVDLAKNVFEIAVSQHPGKVAERHRVARTRLLPFFAERQPAVVVLEATGSAHYWGRRLREIGHQPILLPPRAVQRYREGNKTDRTDAKAMLEAVRNEAIRPVPIKSIAQQAMTSLHRLRSSWMATRTARINTVRGLLRELGVTLPVGSRKLVPSVMALLADSASDVPIALRGALGEACEEIGQLRRASRSQQRFPTARHFASYLGLTPRERSSGDQRRLGRISKRGDTYLRCLLTHGARAVLRVAHLPNANSRLHSWALGVEGRRGHNVAAIALANKLARVVWAVWRSDRSFA